MWEKNTSAFTFLELVVSLTILSLLAVVVAISFSSFDREQSLDKATLTIMAVLNDAKTNADSSKGASNWGVRVQKNQITEFEGSYGTQNTNYTLSNLIVVGTSTGIGTDIIFQNVTGATSASGTITVSVKNNSAQYNTIRVYSSGVIEKN
jgi:type II secretory pathway pseudopilin PulG